MADFRRCFIALAVLALMAGVASAQIGTINPGSTSAGPLACTANAAGTPQLRSEGYTELVGDILITCIGGTSLPIGSQIPTTNITVYMTPANPITSRLASSGSGPAASDALLIIDDAGSALPTGAAPTNNAGGYGPQAPQTLCADNPGSSGGCPAYVGLDGNGAYFVATATSSTANAGAANAANIYQGWLNEVGVQTVTFYGVPVLPPITSGVSRTFRITNIRYPTVGLGNTAGVSVVVSTSPSTVLPINGTTNLLVGIVVDPGMKAAIYTDNGTPVALPPPTTATTTPTVFQQCDTTKTVATPTVDLVYTEGFATAFKTRVVPQSNTTWNAEANGGGKQNIPGGLYNGFAQNSESGFIFPSLTVTKGTTNYTAGLADFGTRLKAIFTNIPLGITLYVSGSNSTPATIIGGTSVQATAVLVPSETTTDPSTGSSSSFPSGSTFTAIALTPNSSGVATAVWEVTNSNPAAFDQLLFRVYIAYTSNPGSTTNTPYGLPQITGIGNPTVNNVRMMFAPEPSQGAFSQSAGTTPGTDIIPRFINEYNYNGPFVTIILCQTTLLFPYVTANPQGGLGQGFDTGMAIANTSKDPFTGSVAPTGFPASLYGLNIPTTPAAGTLSETGSCTLYPYGNTISSTNVLGPAPAPLQGCDTILNGQPGTNCFPVVPSGSVAVVNAFTVFPTFQGYVIAVCNFQYAHGYAAVTDLGLRGLFSSYLAIELNNCTSVSQPGTCVVGQPRGVSIEFNSH